MKNILDDIEFLGLSIKKEIIVFLCINILLVGACIGLFFLNLGNYFLIIFGCLIIVFDYAYFTRYASKKETLIKQRDGEFIELLSYYEIFISNGLNVYKSFEALVPYCGDWMKEKVERLIEEIDHDKTVKPYINFSSNFSYLIIQSVMISIYEMVDDGENNKMANQFNVLFNQLSKNHQQSLIDKKRRSLEVINSFPLIGAALITVILTFSIVSAIGEISNVF